MAEKKFFVDINLQGNKLANAVVGANSSMTSEGSFQYNNGRLEYYNGATVEEVANLSDISAVTGGLIFQGGYDASTNTPDIADGSTLKGFFWAVTVSGTFLGESVQVGDSIVAKIDGAGATLSDWLILQGNVVIATDSVDGISRLATQTEANDGTEGGAVVITPATLQGKIDAQITPEISSKLPLAGGTMSGTIDMNGYNIDNASQINNVNDLWFLDNGNSAIHDLDTLNATNARLVNLSPKIGETEIVVGGTLNIGGNGQVKGLLAPTDNQDAANKEYVDNAASTAESNANAYTDTQIAAQSFTGVLLSSDWTLNGSTYEAVLTHNLNSTYPIAVFFDNSTGKSAEFAYEPTGDFINNITVYSNILPVSIQVSLVAVR